MSLKGILDFQQTLQFNTEEVQAYYSYESGDVYVLPDSIGLSVTKNGKPDLTITLVKSQHPLSPTTLYGTIDISLALLHPTVGAIKALRSAGSTAKVIPAACTGGYLPLEPV